MARARLEKARRRLLKISQQQVMWGSSVRNNLLLGDEYDKADEDQEKRSRRIATNAIEVTTSFRKPESEMNGEQAETSIDDDLSGITPQHVRWDWTRLQKAEKTFITEFSL